MKILSSLLLLIVGVLFCVKIAHAYGAIACTLRIPLINRNTAAASIGSPLLKNGSYKVFADVADCDPADEDEGEFANNWVFALATETGPLHAKGKSECFVEGFTLLGKHRRVEDDSNN